MWTYEFARATLSRLTTDPARTRSPLWTPDGQRIVFTSTRAGYHELFWRPADGTGSDERFLTRAKDLVDLHANGWSADGRQLLFDEVAAGSRTIQCAVGQIPIERPSDVTVLVEERILQRYFSRVSPNGRWMAYTSNVSGRYEIYVERYPELGSRQQISTSGGRRPLWSRDGRELFFVSLDGRQLFAVPVESGTTLVAGRPAGVVRHRHAGAYRWDSTVRHRPRRTVHRHSPRRGRSRERHGAKSHPGAKLDRRTETPRAGEVKSQVQRGHDAAAANKMRERILYLVRHGQLDMRAFEKDQIRAGLTDVGREQDEITAEYLRFLDVDALYSSTLGRALESAVIISKRFPNTVVSRSDLLRELPNLGHPNFAEGKRRGERAFARFVQPTRRKQRIDLVISHGNVIRYLRAERYGFRPNRGRCSASSHCGITQMRVADGTVQIIGYNQVTHLPTRLRL